MAFPPPYQLVPNLPRYELERHQHRRFRRLVKDHGNRALATLLTLDDDAPVWLRPHELAAHWPALEAECRRQGSSFVDPLARLRSPAALGRDIDVDDHDRRLLDDDHRAAAHWLAYQLTALSGMRRAGRASRVDSYFPQHEHGHEPAPEQGHCLERLQALAEMYHGHGLALHRDQALHQALRIFAAIPAMLAQGSHPHPHPLRPGFLGTTASASASAADSALVGVVVDMAKLFVPVVAASVLEAGDATPLYDLIRSLARATGRDRLMLAMFVRTIPLPARDLLRQHVVALVGWRGDVLAQKLFEVGV